MDVNMSAYNVCLYKDCYHNSLNNSCLFRNFPNNDCAFDIWKKNASVRLVQIRNQILNQKYPALCACHFENDNEYPTKYEIRLLKRKQLPRETTLSEPSVKHCKSGDVDENENESEANFESNETTLSDPTIKYYKSGYVNENESEVCFEGEEMTYSGLTIEICKSSDILDNKNESSDFSEDDLAKLSEAVIENCESFHDNESGADLEEYWDENFSLYEEYIDDEAENSDFFLNNIDLSEEYENCECIEELVEDFDSYQIQVVEIAATSNLMQETEVKSKLQEMEKLQKEVETMKSKVKELENRLVNKSFDFEDIAHSDQKVFQYTGLPSKAIFNIVLKTMSKFHLNYVLGWSVASISMKNQLLITLMKLRMDLRYYDLAERFKCSEATVSNVVRSWVLAMHEIFFQQLMVQIPSRKKNKKSLPNVFKEFLNCRIVLDCTEMFTDKPVRMDRQKDIYSQYKHHVTFKPLVGAAPNGVATYSSKLYPGSTSDKKIVQHCGVVNQLDPGDLVLADKGFVIRDVLPNSVQLNLPPFLNTPQFTRQQVRETELIAKARVHIERVINRIKNFRSLKYIPAEMFKMSSEIFQLCVALTNFQYPIIREVANFL